jgi:flavin-dependent dehydrogenase
MWSYAHSEAWQEGTTLYSENRPDEYFSWVWEIPITPEKMSIGYVTEGSIVKRQRAQGQSVEDIFRNELGKFQRFEQVLREGNLETPVVRSFHCRVCKRVCGPNWVIAGEAAAVPDPITGNGVTAALRHATEGTRLMLRYNKRKRIPWYVRTSYNLRVAHMARFFNSLIERLAYDRILRRRFGLLKTGDVYTALAWSMNHLYSRMGPRGTLMTTIFCASLSAFRAIAWLAERIVRLMPASARLVTRGAY